MQRLRVDLRHEQRRAMADDVIVVRPAAGVDEEQPVAVGEPVLLRVVAAEFFAVVEGPRPHRCEVQTVVADADVAAEVVAHREEVAAAEENDRGFDEAALDGEIELVAVANVTELLAVEAALDDGD